MEAKMRSNKTLQLCSFLRLAIHLTRELALDEIAVPRDAVSHALADSGHELGVLQIVIPLQFNDLIDALVEDPEDVNRALTVTLIVRCDVAFMFSPDVEFIVSESALNPVQHL